jgi:hypothetical protein
MERDRFVAPRHVGTRWEKGAPLGSEYALFRPKSIARCCNFHFPPQMGPFFDTRWITDPSRQFDPERGCKIPVQAKITAMGSVKLTVVYGRDLREGVAYFTWRYRGVSHAELLRQLLSSLRST